MITVNWSQLSTELLTRIVENHLPSLDDVVAFSSVCHSWNRAARFCDKSKLRENWSRQMPWLMLTDGNDAEVYSDTDSYREHMYENNVMGLDDDDDDDADNDNADADADDSDVDADNDNVDADDDDADNADDDVADNDNADDDDDADNDNADDDDADDDDVADNDSVDDADDDVADNDNVDDSFYTSSDEDGNQLEEVQNKPYYSNINDAKRELLNLSNNRNKCYNLSLPEIYGKACWGSRYGWIVTLGLNREMHLFNPITKAQLPLPPQTTFRYPWKLARGKTIRVMYFSKLVVLQVVPQDDQNQIVPWLVVAIHRNYSLVAIARPTDPSWMHIKWGDGLHVFMDVIYCHKLKSLLFVDSEGDLYCYDIHNSEQPQAFKEYLKGPDDLIDDENLEAYTYLVQSGDDLLIVARYKSNLGPNDYYDGDRHYKTMTFRVFRLGYPTRSWEELRDMGNIALFVGGNETVSIVASEGGCKSNCIYFCDEETAQFRLNRDKVGGHDLGVFNLRTKTIQSIYHGNNRKSSYCSPIWFSPAI